MAQTTRNISIRVDDSFSLSEVLNKRIAVSKNMLTMPNSAQIEVFNISSNTFKKLLDAEKLIIELENEKLYEGKIMNVSNSYFAPNWKCTIYCNDVHLMPNPNASYATFPIGTTHEDVLNALTKKISQHPLQKNETFSKCKKSNGSLAKEFKVAYKKEDDILKAMQSMFKRCGTTAVKEDGKVKLLDRTTHATTDTANKTTGVSKSKLVLNYDNPLLFQTLLQAPILNGNEIELEIPIKPALKLGVAFKIKSKSKEQQFTNPYTQRENFEDKIYRVIELIHSVDTFSQAIATTKIRGEYV